jgi:hypothetical protein
MDGQFEAGCGNVGSTAISKRPLCIAPREDDVAPENQIYYIVYIFIIFYSR